MCTTHDFAQARALHDNPLSMDARLALASATPTMHAAAAARLVAPLLQNNEWCNNAPALRAAVWQTLRGTTASSVAAWVDPRARHQLALHVGRIMSLVHRQPHNWTAIAAAAVLVCRLAEARVAAGGLGNWGAVQALCTRACALRTEQADDDDFALHVHVMLSHSEALLRQGQFEAARVQVQAALVASPHASAVPRLSTHIQLARVHAARGEHEAAMEALHAVHAAHADAVAATQAALQGELPQGIMVAQENPQQQAVAALLQAAQRVAAHEGDCYQAVQPTLKQVQQAGLMSGVHACVLLALAAVQDTDRKAKGRAESNAAKAIRQWPGGVPAAVWGVLVGGGVGGRVACCAVHACPWERRLWAALPRRTTV